jgi:Xaa-Pro aminopeptidase
MRHAERRARLVQADPTGVTVLPAPAPAVLANDIEHRYRPEANLLYLTGLEEPGAVAVIRSAEGQPELTLFVRPRDPLAEQWQGTRVGPERAVSRYGAAAAHALEAFDEKLPELLVGCCTLYYRLGRDRGMDDRVLGAVDRARSLARVRGIDHPYAIVEPQVRLGAMRAVKDPEEIALLRRAARLTAAGQLAALRAIRPGLHERDLEALLESELRRRGARGPSNPTIVGAGVNGTVLHYVDNAAPLVAGELVLIDAGADVDGYCGDITRTAPVSGRFTPIQRQVYEIVLAAHTAACAAIRPGVDLAAVHAAAGQELAAGLVALGVLRGDPAQRFADRDHVAYYPHRTSHLLGLDVHDPGPLPAAAGGPVLEPDMVLTVEPGLYFLPDLPDLPAGLAGIGVRIEDDLLVTPSGAEILTGDVPRTVPEIEALVGADATRPPG